jgi:orotidine-5'-phosphate decarboxylase
VLDAVLQRCRRRGLLVLLDAKRGDIGSTAAAYARAYLEPDAPLRADALTVHPYMGDDGLAPFAEAAERAGAGVFALVRTSNPGAADLQDLAGPDGVPLYERVAQLLARRAPALRGPETGWSLLGAVVGATAPGQARRIRELLPHSVLLVPGYGAQGASAAAALGGFVRGPAGLEGGIVNSSRAILFPPGRDGGARAWEAAFDTALRAAIEELGSLASRG